MDYGKSFAFVFEDEEWVSKVLIGTLFTILSGALIGLPFLMGYYVELVANVRKGLAKPLPRWDNLGQKFADGLMLAIAFFVYALPIFVVMVPYIIVIAAVDGGNNGSGDGSGLAALLSICFACVAILWGIVVALLSPAITIRFAETRAFGAMFRFGDLWEFTRRHLGEVIIVILLGWVASFIGGIVGTILCIVGVLATSFWAALVQYHLYAQVGLPQTQPPLTPPPAPELTPTA